MDELIKLVKERYIEGIITPLDLDKITIFIIYLIVFQFTVERQFDSIWLSIGMIDFNSFFSLDNFIWNELILARLILSISMTALTCHIFKELKDQFFKNFSKLDKTDQYFESLARQVKSSMSRDISLNIIIFKEFKEELKKQQQKNSGFHLVSEFSLVGVFISIIGICRFNWFDIPFLIAFSVLLIYCQWKAFLFYVRHIAPALVAWKIGTYQTTDFGDSF